MKSWSDFEKALKVRTKWDIAMVFYKKCQFVTIGKSAKITKMKRHETSFTRLGAFIGDLEEGGAA